MNAMERLTTAAARLPDEVIDALAVLAERYAPNVHHPSGAPDDDEAVDEATIARVRAAGTDPSPLLTHEQVWHRR